MSKKKAEQDSDDRVRRGGCCFNSPAHVRVVTRLRDAPGCRFDNLGVRLVRRRSALERLAESLRGVSDGQDEG